MKLIDSINSPADLKKLPVSQLSQVAAEIREIMLDRVSRHGGHLASSLGAVELTIALHYCYDTPVDKLVWDVGHQSYAHKILTGRRDRFDTLRQFGGISGFPRIAESDYDAVSVGHASTSISAGLGLAIGRDLRGQRHAVVAIIGDGSLSGGLALEGLNNLGSLSTNMTVVLNDNSMSISKNVGALSRYLLRVITDRRFNKIKSEIWELTGHLSNVGKRIRSLVHNIDETLKHFVIPGKLFEDMGLRYFGPVDGHNIAEMIEVFNFVRESAPGPVLVHVLSTKGKGYSFAENDATKYHGVGCFSLSTGAAAPSAGAPSYSDVFGAAIVEWARKRDDIVAITAAMPDGTGLSAFAEEFPGRFFDVGIAESHAVTFAAGLALKGLKPVVAIYSTFLQRAFDQIVHDVALDKLNVTFCIDRAGIVGEDGPTHHGAFDLSYLRGIPGVLVMAPRNAVELKRMVHTAMLYCDGPVFIRYPRGCSSEIAAGDDDGIPIPLYEPKIMRQGASCAVVAVGDAFANAEAACAILAESGTHPELIDARFIKPLNQSFYRGLFERHRRVVTLENNALAGGFGSGLMELASSLETSPPPEFLRLGYPDEFIPHGTKKELLKLLELDPEAIGLRIKKFLGH
jgi:1-deoxy-D-xylulose-5-phosphate synthase